jgi:hypothetical protein
MKKESLQIKELRSTIREVIKQSLREETTFDFEDFDDTDLSGAGIEIAIDDLLADFQESIDKVLANNPTLKSKARIEIKKMIVDKIKNWR